MLQIDDYYHYIHVYSQFSLKSSRSQFNRRNLITDDSRSFSVLGEFTIAPWQLVVAYSQPKIFNVPGLRVKPHLVSNLTGLIYRLFNDYFMPIMRNLKILRLSPKPLVESEHLCYNITVITHSIMMKHWLFIYSSVIIPL